MAAGSRFSRSIWWLVAIVAIGLFLRRPRAVAVLVGLALVALVVFGLLRPGLRRRRARHEERASWAAAPAALAEAKERLLLDDDAGMWHAVRRALFVPRDLPWTLRMVEHDRQVVALLAEHCRDQLTAPDAEALDRLASHLAGIRGASDLPRIDPHRFAPVISLAHARGAGNGAAP